MKTFFDNVKLLQLTNTNTPGATTINDTVGTRAETTAQAIFKRIVGVTYDATDADHENVMWNLIIYLLESWGNHLGDQWAARKQTVYDELKDLQLVTARKRVTPVTSSPLVVTDDTRDGAIAEPQPAFDLEHFDNVTPNTPQGGQGSTFPNPFPS